MGQQQQPSLDLLNWSAPLYFTFLLSLSLKLPTHTLSSFCCSAVHSFIIIFSAAAICTAACPAGSVPLYDDDDIFLSHFSRTLFSAIVDYFRRCCCCCCSNIIAIHAIVHFGWTGKLNLLAMSCLMCVCMCVFIFVLAVKHTSALPERKVGKRAVVRWERKGKEGAFITFPHQTCVFQRCLLSSAAAAASNVNCQFAESIHPPFLSFPILKPIWSSPLTL